MENSAQEGEGPLTPWAGACNTCQHDLGSCQCHSGYHSCSNHCAPVVCNLRA